MNVDRAFAVDRAMFAATITAFTLLALSVVAVLVFGHLQAREVRRIRPSLLILLAAQREVTPREVTPLEATAWLSKHGREVHPSTVSSALRELERDGEATSRLSYEDLPPARGGLPVRLYRLAK